MVLFFYLFSALTLYSSFAVVFSRNPVSSVLWLVFAFLSSSGLFILLDAEFIAISIVIVYVGAIAVLFLFVIMMIGGNTEHFKYNFSAHFLFNCLIAFIIAISITLVGAKSLKNYAMQVPLSNTETFKILGAGGELNQRLKQELTNTHSIGEVLYTDYIIGFQLCGFILLTAMIGSIVLTIRKSKDAKRQNSSEQLMRDPVTSIEIKKVKFNEGVSDIKYE